MVDDIQGTGDPDRAKKKDSLPIDPAQNEDEVENSTTAEEDDDDEEEEDEEEDDGEEDEPKLKHARLTSSLGPVYRNGDATSAFLVAGDKMVRRTCASSFNEC